MVWLHHNTLDQLKSTITIVKGSKGATTRTSARTTLRSSKGPRRVDGGADEEQHHGARGVASRESGQQEDAGLPVQEACRAAEGDRQWNLRVHRDGPHT